MPLEFNLFICLACKWDIVPLNGGQRSMRSAGVRIKLQTLHCTSLAPPGMILAARIMPGGAREVSIDSTPWNCDYDERLRWAFQIAHSAFKTEHKRTLGTIKLQSIPTVTASSLSRHNSESRVFHWNRLFYCVSHNDHISVLKGLLRKLVVVVPSW